MKNKEKYNEIERLINEKLKMRELLLRESEEQKRKEEEMFQLKEETIKRIIEDFGQHLMPRLHYDEEADMEQDNLANEFEKK